MKILQVNKFNYIRGGAEKYFIEISKELEKIGHQVALFSMHHPKNNPSKWDKYFVSRISFNEAKLRDRIIAPGRILYSLEAKRKFNEIVKAFRPDIIHIHNIYHQISPSILSVAKEYNIPVIMHLHDYKLICPNYQLFVDDKICYRCRRGKYYNCLQHKCFKKSFWQSFLATIEMYLHHRILKIYKKNISYFIAPSEFMKKTIIDFGWDKNKIKVIYNFSEKMEDKVFDEAGDYGLYFGRLSREKGIDILIRALSMSDKKNKLNIVGTGPEENNLKKLVKELKLSRRVSFLGYKSGQELQDIIRRARLIYLPSTWNENMPLTLLESLNLNKVVIASRTGGLPELIKDKETGFLFKNGDVKELSQVIDNSYNYDLIKMGVKAKESVEDLKIERHLIELLDVYNNILKK
ncbi:MAG TPA: glycosyltransferase [bacterium]|nr:glycosyltransferase [bacterium]